MSKVQVTAIEFDKNEQKKYASTNLLFDTNEAAEEWVKQQFRTEYCEHYGVHYDDFEESAYGAIEFLGGRERTRAEYEIGDSEYLYLFSRVTDPLNAIESFMYYMWNAFCDHEIERIRWSCNAEHFISKWHHYCEKYGPNGAISPFFGDLDATNRQTLVDRALSIYDGKHNINRKP